MTRNLYKVKYGVTLLQIDDES